MEKDLILFQKEELTFSYKFYTLIDLLITNQAESRFESFLLLCIFYLQILSTFFPKEIGIFDSENSKSDQLLSSIQKLLRLKGLFTNSYSDFRLIYNSIFIIIILAIAHFIFSCYKVTRNSFYSYNNMLINYYIKIFLYIGYNIIYDMCFSNFCFGRDQYNPNFTSVKCSTLSQFSIVLSSILLIIISFCLYLLITTYYNDSFYLSSSYYAKISCNYDNFWGINCLFMSCLSIQVKFITKEVFLIYNFFISILLLYYYLKHYLYYDKYINALTGIFHTLYAWTSIFCLIFAYINFTEKGIVYILTSIIVCFFYSSIKNRIENKIFLETPFYKINNQYYLLYYFHNLIEKINNVEENSKDKSFLAGIIQMHELECPCPNCLLKTKEDIYIPSMNKWYDKTKNEIEDEVFLKYFIIIIMNYFLYYHECSVDMYLNLSLYYLQVIGNYCQAIYYYKKVTELKLTLKEYYSFIRLRLQISRKLTEKLKPSNEQCSELENLDVSMYFKYDVLSQAFVDEINNDVNLSLEFWKAFRTPLIEYNKTIDFNKIFKLTDKIRITKKNIENMWNDLLQIYGGVNDFFQLYMEYIEQINDDDLKKRDLEALKRKNDNFGDHINLNFYSVLFNKETGIIIANGDKGSEGIIQLANNEIENIFKYKPVDLKGMNISVLMPKIFSINHSKYIERYFEVGQKKLIDKPGVKIYAKDKLNSMLKISLSLKLFPILNDNVYILSLIIKENIDDIILLDNKFIIQGMSLKLKEILSINNPSIFQDNEIPFYAICRKFVNFYSIFLKDKQKKDVSGSEKQTMIIEEEKNKEKEEESNKDESKEKKEESDDKDEIHENIEINENVELEYEIKLPKFLLDYAEKTNKSINVSSHHVAFSTEADDINETIDESDEKDLLLKPEKNKIKNLISNSQTPTPIGETPDTENTPQLDSNIDTTNRNDLEKKIGFNKLSEEEKIYNNYMNQYKTLFTEGKIDELESLIDICNKDSSSIEYKFNFTFDKLIYGNKQVCYIVRCVDNKNDFGKSQEESDNQQDINVVKYKKEKIDSIKDYFELYEQEKEEIIELQKEFLKLSSEDKKFQKLLQQCKNDINTMSKIHGQKRLVILEDENSSQSSSTGYDSRLVKKNRIEEIRSNLLMNISSFYTLKYLKIVILCIAIFTCIFSIVFVFFFSELYNNLQNTAIINNNLFQSCLWTTEIISIFISLRTLFQKNLVNFVNYMGSFYFYDYFTPNNSLSTQPNTALYYNTCISMVTELYNKSLDSFEILEMQIPNYLNDEQLMNLYWNRINISYMNNQYYSFSHVYDNESYPMAIDQFLSDSIYFIENNVFKKGYETNYTLTNAENLLNSESITMTYFNYLTHIVIENAYDNILPNQISKLLNIPNILSEYNGKKKKAIIILVIIYACIMILLCITYLFLIHLTNKSMTDGIEKVAKIQLEKIEETIKKIKLFNINLKKFREKDLKNSDNDNKNDSKIGENENNQNNESQRDLNGKESKKKLEQKSSLINSSGFNTDFQKYIPLKILKYTFLPALLIFVVIFVCLIPVYILIINMVHNTNQLLLVQNHIYGKLITTSINTIEIKCFMSECENQTNLVYGDLVNMDLMQDIIKGVNVFPEISEFYNEKFLLNACSASMVIDPNNKTDVQKYEECMNDSIIISANNTENLIKLIEDFVHNIKKEYEMDISIRGQYIYPPYNKRVLYNSTYFRDMEYIFYHFIYRVGDNFEYVLTKDLDRYLKNKLVFVATIIVIMGILTVIYCLIFGIIFIKKLIHYLSISRCIMKIIPTTVIVNTQELEDWIESKY